MQTPLTTREAWLIHFAEKYLWPRIEAAGGEPAAEVSRERRLSQRSTRQQRSQHRTMLGPRKSAPIRPCEIFVSPELDATLAVECIGS